MYENKKAKIMNVDSIYRIIANSPLNTLKPVLQGVSSPLLPSQKKDEFVLTSKKDVSACSKTEDFQKHKDFSVKLVNLYKEKQFEEVSNIPYILGKIKTSEEIDFLEKYIDKNKNRVTNSVIKKYCKRIFKFS